MFLHVIILEVWEVQEQCPLVYKDNVMHYSPHSVEQCVDESVCTYQVGMR